MDPILADLPPDLTQLQATIVAAAAGRDQDCLALFQLLRVLEECHRQIRDGVFQDSLPTSRHELYALLQDLEAQGDWPQIPRTRIEAFLNLLKTQVETRDPLTQDALSSVRPEPAPVAE